MQKLESKEAGKHRGESRSRASGLSDVSNSDVATDDKFPRSEQPLLKSATVFMNSERVITKLAGKARAPGTKVRAIEEKPT